MLKGPVSLKIISQEAEDKHHGSLMVERWFIQTASSWVLSNSEQIHAIQVLPTKVYNETLVWKGKENILKATVGVLELKMSKLLWNIRKREGRTY